MKLILGNKNNTVKASSLTNAIFICLIISIFCGCLVLISHFQKILNTKLELNNHLISRNNSSFNYFLNTIESFPFNTIQETDIFDDGIISFAEKKNWGFYDILVCKTVFKTDTITKMALIGKKSRGKNRLALYTTDYDKPLKLSGKTKILGNIKVPFGRTEQAYINGHEGNSVQIKGTQLKAEDRLPKIDKDISITTFGYKDIPFNTIKETTFINAFDKETQIINLNGIRDLSDITIKGNIILTSNGEIEINNSSSLSDVLIMAPSVVVKSGFKGSIQIMAQENVTIEENVSLLYPSSIYVKNDVDSVNVTIQKGTKIIGGIVVDGNTYNGSLKRKLTIEENTNVIGNVYCYGSTQLQGDIIGSVYSDRFFLKTTSSNYENVILNATINRDSLPEHFIELPLFRNNVDEKKYEIIKTF